MKIEEKITKIAQWLYDQEQTYVTNANPTNLAVKPKQPKENVTMQPKENVTMTHNSDSATMEMIFDDVKDGMKISGATGVAKMLVAQVRTALGDTYPKFFSTDLGRAVEPMLVSMLVVYLAGEYDFIPSKDRVQQVARYALKGSSKEVTDHLVSRLMPVFTQIAAIPIHEESKTIAPLESKTIVPLEPEA